MARPIVDAEDVFGLYVEGGVSRGRYDTWFAAFEGGASHFTREGRPGPATPLIAVGQVTLASYPAVEITLGDVVSSSNATVLALRGGEVDFGTRVVTSPDFTQILPTSDVTISNVVIELEDIRAGSGAPLYVRLRELVETTSDYALGVSWLGQSGNSPPDLPFAYEYTGCRPVSLRLLAPRALRDGTGVTEILDRIALEVNCTGFDLVAGAPDTNPLGYLMDDRQRELDIEIWSTETDSEEYLYVTYSGAFLSAYTPPEYPPLDATNIVNERIELQPREHQEILYNR